MSSNDTLNIRGARPDDAPALALLLAELGFPDSAAAIAERLNAMLAKEEIVLVADRDGEVLALLTVHITPVLHRSTPVGRLTALIVNERVRGQGVGRALVEAAEGVLSKRGCALVEVTSNRKMIDAHAFYEKLGYEVTSLRFKKALTTA